MVLIDSVGCGGGGRGSGSRGGGGREASQQPTGSEQKRATAMDVSLGLVRWRKETGEEAGAILKERRGMTVGMRVASLGEDVDGTPSWMLEDFESAEAEQECLGRWKREMCSRASRRGGSGTSGLMRT